jgi:hypothetical protein
MPKLVWIENNSLFKIIKVYSTQYLCICSNSYKEELALEIGDTIFIKDENRQKSFKRLGIIKAFNEPNKIIISIMSDIGIYSKAKIQILHNKSLEEKEISENEIVNDGSLY